MGKLVLTLATIGLAAILILSGFVGTAEAITLEFTYAGGNATASGWIVIKDSEFNNPTLTSNQNEFYYFNNQVTAFGMTVVDNGVSTTYDMNNYTHMLWYTNDVTITMLNTAYQNIVHTDTNSGQRMYHDPDEIFDDVYFGELDKGLLAGNFSLDGASGGAPTFYGYFQLITGTEDVMNLTNLHSVPEPATILMMGSGLLGFAFWRRRKGFPSLGAFRMGYS